MNTGWLRLESGLRGSLDHATPRLAFGALTFADRVTPSLVLCLEKEQLHQVRDSCNMSRWHARSCREPDIIVEDGLPRCQACRAMPNLQGLVDQQRRLEAEFGLPWTVPKDEPIGEMNLFWPDCVQYARPEDQEATDQDEQQGDSNNQLTESTGAVYVSTEPPSSQGSERRSYIYGRRLGDDEFRLVCLSAANHHPDVIHITLETYPNDDCPEYETVSYAWGGEDGNSAQRHPVYVGEYWDVMLHSRNCWSLLSYLQPKRGIRLAWVDSLCINQLDNKEKIFQVGVMGVRYRNCTRVVVYLGPDYAVPAPPGSHPRRVPFHEMPDATFQRISQARYFRRIWIVQELVMAPSAIVPVDGTDFVVGRDTITARFRTGHDPRWDSSQAPWMSQISTGSTVQHQGQQTQLLNALRLTVDSESSDPRDRIFGILGLMHADIFSAANYELSTAHVTIGVFSHFILNLKRVDVLLGASSRRNTQLGYPTWLPNWKSSITFEETKYPGANMTDLSQLLQDLAHQILLGTPNSQNSKLMKTIQILLGGSDSGTDNCLTPSCGPMCAHHQVFRVTVDAWNEAIGWPSFYDEHGLIGLKAALTIRPHSLWGTSLDGPAIPWDEGVNIRSASGALSMHLTHLLHFTTQPEVAMSIPDMCLLRIRSDASPHTADLFLGTLPNPNADFFSLEPGRKDLFILPGTADKPPLILFMKQQTGGSGFRLLACCNCVDLFFMASDPSRRMNQPLGYMEDTIMGLNRKVQVFHKALESIGDYPLWIEGRKVFHEENFEPLFLRRQWSAWDILFVIQGLINQRDGKPGGLLALRLERVAKRKKGHHPQLVGDYLEIALDLQECGYDILRILRKGLGRSGLARYAWEIETEAGTWELLRACRYESEFPKLRLPMAEVEEFLSRCIYYWMLRQFTPYSRKTGVDEYGILRGGPKKEYRPECCLDVPEEIREAFNVDLWTRLVAIV